MGIHIYFINNITHPSIKSQISGITGKVISYLEILNIFHHTDAINEPS